MKLTELKAHFQRYSERDEDANVNYPDAGGVNRVMREYKTPVDTLDEAHGIMFLCPVCFAKNGGSVGTHSVDVTFSGRGVPDNLGSHGTNDLPTRWDVSGTGLADLVCTPSIQLLGGCNWHGFIGSSGVPPGEAA